MTKKKLRVIGIIDKEGFEIDNRVYDRGGLSYSKSRKYEYFGDKKI